MWVRAQSRTNKWIKPLDCAREGKTKLIKWITESMQNSTHQKVIF
jgi:hypothetical protein